MIKWMLPVSDGNRKEPYIAYNAKYHCFVCDSEKDERFVKVGKSLCGRHQQDMDYDTEITDNDIHIWNKNLCKKCLEKYGEARNKEMKI